MKLAFLACFLLCPLLALATEFQLVLPKPPLDEAGFPIPVKTTPENKLLPTDLWWVLGGQFSSREEATAYYAWMAGPCMSRDFGLHIFSSDEYEGLKPGPWYYVVATRRTRNEADKRKRQIEEELKQLYEQCREKDAPRLKPLQIIHPGLLRKRPELIRALKEAGVDLPADFVCWARYRVSPDFQKVVYTQRYEWKEEGGEAWGPWNVEENLSLLYLKEKKRLLVYDLMLDAADFHFSSDGRYLLFDAQTFTNTDFAANQVRVFDTHKQTLYKLRDCGNVMSTPETDFLLRSCLAPRWAGTQQIQFERLSISYGEERFSTKRETPTIPFRPGGPSWEKAPYGFSAAHSIFTGRQEETTCLGK